MFVIVQVKKFTENYMVSLNMNFPGFWVNLKKKSNYSSKSDNIPVYNLKDQCPWKNYFDLWESTKLMPHNNNETMYNHF